MKHYFISILIVSFFLTSAPLAYAQVTNASPRSAQTNQVLQQFQPGVNIQSSGTKIGGVSFNGVGASILGCTNIGKSVVSGISSLFTKKAKKASGAVTNALGLGALAGVTGGQKVPTTDADAQKKIDESNKKLEEANKKESCLDAIAYTLAKQALTQVTNKTLNWVNTGFGGNPFYVRNIDSFLGSIKNDQIRDYIRIADNINTNNGDGVSVGVTNKIIEMLTGRSAGIPVPSTQSEQKYDAFTKDFTQGGWDAWYNMTQLGENPIAGVLTTSQQLGKNIGQQQINTKAEVSQGNGFLSQKQCVAWEPLTASNDYLEEDATGTKVCTKYETVTPGSVIAAQTQTVTNSSTRQLEAADELNEVLGAFFDSLLNKLFNKGLQTLGRNSGDNFGNSLSGFGGAGSNVVTGSNGQPINGTGSGVILPNNQANDSFDTSSFNISNPGQLAAIIKTQKSFLNRALDSQASLEKIIPNLGHLDYCLPGPHPTWVSDTEASSDGFFVSVENASVPNTFSNVFTTEPYDLLDSLKNEARSFQSKTYFVQGAGAGFSLGHQIATLFDNWFSNYKTTVTASFSEQALSSAFKSTETTATGQAYAEGFVADALNETSQLPEYLQSVVTTDGEYGDAITDTRSTITELESIRSEVLDIVTTARARYIAARQAQGNPVNMSCLNQAYDMSTNPIVGEPRQEEDATAELDALQSAQTSFYNSL